MPADFLQAARRHLADADALEGMARHQNADHLYGFAAECALKAVLAGVGVIPDAAKVQWPYKQHINKLWGEYCSALESRQQERYLQRLPAANPFAKWRADDRYEPDWLEDQIPIEAVRRRQSTREAVLLTLQDAVLDGVVP